MDIKTIIGIIISAIAAILSIVGVTVYVIRKKDSNKIKNLNQQSLSNGNVNQAGRDINVK